MGKAAGPNEFSPVEALPDVCVCMCLCARMHIEAGRARPLRGGSQWRDGVWPGCLTPEQGQHVSEKPPHVDNTCLTHTCMHNTCITKALLWAAFVGLVKAGKSLISNP